MALTNDRELKRQDGEIVAYNVKSGARIYKGALVCVENGELVPATPTGIFVGVACEGGKNPADLSLNLKDVVRVYKTGIFEVKMIGATSADIGKIVYLVDDETVATTGTVECGSITALGESANTVRIRLKEVR